MRGDGVPARRLHPPGGMAAPVEAFHETHLATTAIRDLGLAIAGSRLQPIVEEFLAEVDALGLPFRPRCYLSTEWGVPFATIAIAIPFYLARPELEALHAEHTGFVEGIDRRDILRYLRHEHGHVVNYAYRLYEREEWVERFGPITQPYREEYRPRPFSRRFVRHLPGWYAQKHPDEDWAETFAVWMTPGRDWRRDYEAWPGALEKLEYCAATMAALRGAEPLTREEELDVDVGEVPFSIADYYGEGSERDAPLPGIDGALRTLFEEAEEVDGGEARPAAGLLRRLQRSLPAEVFRWTGHFPEHTRALLRQMAVRAEELAQVYPAAREEQVERALAVMVTALAMSHVQNGSYLP